VRTGRHRPSERARSLRMAAERRKASASPELRGRWRTFSTPDRPITAGTPM